MSTHMVTVSTENGKALMNVTIVKQGVDSEDVYKCFGEIRGKCLKGDAGEQY